MGHSTCKTRYRVIVAQFMKVAEPIYFYPLIVPRCIPSAVYHWCSNIVSLSRRSSNHQSPEVPIFAEASETFIGEH